MTGTVEIRSQCVAEATAAVGILAVLALPGTTLRTMCVILVHGAQESTKLFCRRFPVDPPQTLCSYRVRGCTTKDSSAMDKDMMPTAYDIV